MPEESPRPNLVTVGTVVRLSKGDNLHDHINCMLELIDNWLTGKWIPEDYIVLLLVSLSDSLGPIMN